ncbi:unnamed protein product [Mytilus edulis]|uniref:CCHC-type domain-containing protein n=1 Tax=Mytilus edulis TaxID=6550 RepID=A0A8S3Q8K2_MYTED|nr:unnamed protein product [Mytilus edulis]
MGSVLLPDVSGIQNFDISDSTGLSARWKRWLRAFQLFAAGKGVTDVDQKYALLLHTAGMNVQDIFFTLPEGAGEGAYEKAVSALDAYFTPLSNAPYERSIFRSMIQSSSETIEQYITRLRQRADTCDFGNQNAIDERIRDQIIDKCLSHHLRRKLLEKGRTLTLANVRSIAKAMEDSERQAKSIEGQGQVNMIQSKGKQYGKNSFNSGNKSFNSGNKSTCTATCYSCGREGHIRTDPSCPARGKKCRKCKIVGHFDKVCKTKDKSKHGKIRQVVEQPQNNTDDEEYVFSMIGVNQINSVCENIVVNIGNVNLKMIIDSGASCNIMGINLWNYLKDNRVKCVSSKSTKSLFAYGSEEPLKIAGIFTATVQCNNRTLKDIEFVVIEGKGQALLSRNTAEQLGVLQLVHSVSEPGTIKDKYPECFTGVGKLKSFQLQIPIDPDVEPVIQPMRRVPFNLRDKLGKKLDELLDLDIIEHVNEPSQWVSPVVVVPKRSGDDIRLCFDMRQANTAVKRVRHPIPTIDELLQNMNSSKVFTPLRALTRKDATFTWGKDEQRSFDELKRRLANAETLGYYDKSALTKVIADASPVGLGAVLIQEQNGVCIPSDATFIVFGGMVKWAAVDSLSDVDAIGDYFYDSDSWYLSMFLSDAREFEVGECVGEGKMCRRVMIKIESGDLTQTYCLSAAHEKFNLSSSSSEFRRRLTTLLKLLSKRLSHDRRQKRSLDTVGEIDTRELPATANEPPANLGAGSTRG